MKREVGGGSGLGTHVNPWLIHVNVWQKPLQYCKVISLQLIKINGKKCSWQYAYKITEVDDWIWDLREDKTEKQRTEEEKEQDNSYSTSGV